MTLILKNPLVYVARDIERALGMKPGMHGKAGYFVISNDSLYGSTIEKKHRGFVKLVKNPENRQLDTFELLSLPKVADMIAEMGADVVVFQNTSRIERLAKIKGWKIVNPPADLSKMVEEKISQVEWLDRDADLLPPHRIAVAEDISFEGKKFVLQFNHAHTGQGTFVINSKEELEDIQKKFPYRECRITDFIEGPIFTVNAVVTAQGEGAHQGTPATIIGNPSYQITGLKPFTDLPFSTIGNDWALPQVPEYQQAYIDVVAMAQTIGSRLRKSGWRGLFGIDVVYDPVAKKTYLIEINARQPASTTFESEQQTGTNAAKNAATIFEAHIAALLGLDLDLGSPNSLPKVSGSQIVQRVVAPARSIDRENLMKRELTVIEYENELPNKDLFRIQSREGIMEAHNRLNALGEFIRSCIKNS